MYYSFVMLKPDCLERQLTCKIIERLHANIITIEIFDYRLVNEDIIFKHYSNKIDEIGEIFKEMTKNAFVGKYVIPMIVSSNDINIISAIRKIIGTTDPSKADSGTIRRDFGEDSFEKSMQEVRCCANLIHASDCYESYLFESKLWFDEKMIQKYI